MDIGLKLKVKRLAQSIENQHNFHLAIQCSGQLFRKLDSLGV